MLKKNKIKKQIILIAIIIIILIISIILITNKAITGKTINTEVDLYHYTKAICNKDNACQDYEITCKGNKTISTKPITGAVATFDKDWEDPRENPEELCG